MTPDELEAVQARYDATNQQAGQAQVFIDRLYASSRDVPALLAALAEAQRERDELRAHILDIDAHATPYGDIPDEPGWVGTYLLTAGALHRALGKIGHTAPKCQAEADLKLTQQAMEEYRESWRAATGATLAECERLRKALAEAQRERDEARRELETLLGSEDVTTEVLRGTVKRLDEELTLARAELSLTESERLNYRDELERQRLVLAEAQRREELMRPVVEAALPWRAACRAMADDPSRENATEHYARHRDLGAAVDTYETQEGTDG